MCQTAPLLPISWLTQTYISSSFHDQTHSNIHICVKYYPSYYYYICYYSDVLFCLCQATTINCSIILSLLQRRETKKKTRKKKDWCSPNLDIKELSVQDPAATARSIPIWKALQIFKIHNHLTPHVTVLVHNLYISAESQPPPTKKQQQKIVGC